MPISTAIGAAALGGAGLQGLWQYNRDNYFFDVPLKQNRQFQLQNIGMARFALFREDLRDLSGLTTDKVQNYFIVNTLKLGFIVTIFFNFDRIDTEADEMNYIEEQINLLFSVTLMTAFFFLLTSIWFSMHAVMLAEAITTKMLVQACRIPLPSMGEVQRSATDARYFESDFKEAFRVPFLGEGMRKRLSDKLKRPSPTGSERPQEEPVQPIASAEAEDALRCGASMGRRRGLVGLSILEIIDGSVDPELLTDVDTSLEPHLKFYRLIRPTWTAFDLYGKIAMEIGTATLLSGLGYYAIFYLREQKKGCDFAVSSGGWIAYTFLSVLSWYSLLLDLQISFLKHVMLAIPMICAFLGTIFRVNIPDGREDCWLLTGVVFMQTLWVLVICWLSAGFGSDFPSTWRSTRFINVLHQEEGPTPFQRDILSVHKEKPLARYRHLCHNNSPNSCETNGSNGSSSVGTPLASMNWPTPQTRGSPSTIRTARVGHSPTGFLRAAFPEDQSSEDEDSQSDSNDMSMDTLQAFAAAFPLLHCLGLMLETLFLGKQRNTVQQARDRLYEAARAAGALPVGAGSSDTVGLIRPFWIILPPNSKRSSTEAHRIDMGEEPADLQAMQKESQGPQVTLSELLEAVRRVADVLFHDSSTWTVRDMQRFARYGGEPIPGVWSFLAQFHSKGSATTRFAGATATVLFRIGVLITAVLWVTSCIWSINLTAREHTKNRARYNSPEGSSGFAKVTDERPLDALKASGTKVKLNMPRPWLLPSSMGCNSDGKRLVLTDIDGAFIGSPNSTKWRGPVKPCWGAELLSADFGPNGDLWLSTTQGVHSVRLDPSSSSSSRLCTPKPAEAPRLDMISIDSVPPAYSTLLAMALSSGRLHALEADPIEGWRLAGTIGAPIKKEVVAMALRAGHALVLDSLGVVHRLDALTGKWDEPVVMSKDYQWRGLCLLPESGDWFALGRPARTVGVRELWYFSLPAQWKKDSSADEESLGFFPG